MFDGEMFPIDILGINEWRRYWRNGQSFHAGSNGLIAVHGVTPKRLKHRLMCKEPLLSRQR